MIFGSVILPGRRRSHEDINCGFGYEPHGVAHAWFTPQNWAMWRVTDLSGLPSMPFMRRNARMGRGLRDILHVMEASTVKVLSFVLLLIYQDPSRSFKSPCPLLVWLASSPQGILHFAHQKKLPWVLAHLLVLSLTSTFPMGWLMQHCARDSPVAPEVFRVVQGAADKA